MAPKKKSGGRSNGARGRGGRGGRGSRGGRGRGAATSTSTRASTRDPIGTTAPSATGATQATTWLNGSVRPRRSRRRGSLVPMVNPDAIMRAGNAERRRQRAAQRAVQQDDAATAVSGDASQPTAGDEQRGETPDPGTQAHTNDGEQPQGTSDPGEQAQQPQSDQPGIQQGQEGSPSSGKRRQSRSSESPDESPPAKKRKSNEKTRKDDEQSGGLQNDAPEITESACEKLARLIKEKTDQASAASLPLLDEGPQHGRQLYELAVWRAIASVTEGISRNPRGINFSLVDPDNFRWARAGSDMPNTVFRPGNEAFLPRVDQEGNEGHSSLFFLRRDGDRFSFQHYDSARIGPHREERNPYGVTLRDGLTRAAWNNAGLTITKAQDSGNTMRQRGGWECGFYTTIFAWALACGLEIADSTSVPASRNGAFTRDMVVLVRLAMQGFMNSDLLEAFFHCYGLFGPEISISDDRRFASTVALPLVSSLNTRVSLQIQLENYAQAQGITQPLDLDTILERIGDPQINLADYDVERLLRAYRRALGDDQVTPSPRRTSPQESQPTDDTTEQQAGIAGVTQDDIDIDRAVRAGQEQERNRTAPGRDQDTQQSLRDSRNDNNHDHGDNDDDGPPDVPGAGAARRESETQEQMTDQEREQRQVDFNRINSAVRSLLAERGDALAPGGIRELIAELPEQILVPPEHLLIRYEMSSWWYDLLQNWRAFRAAHVPEGTPLTDQHLATFLLEQAERERLALVASGRIAAERSFSDGTDDYTDLQRAQIVWLETHLASTRMMVAERDIRDTSSTDHSYFEQTMMRITPGGTDPLGLTEDEERTVHGVQSAFTRLYNDGDARIDDPALQERWDDVRRTLQDVFRARRDAIRVGVPAEELDFVESTLAQRDDALDEDPEAHVGNLLDAWQRLIRVHADASLRTDDARSAAREQFRSSLLQDEDEEEPAEAPNNGTPGPPKAQFDQTSRYVKFTDSAPATVQERSDVEELRALRRAAPGLARRWEDDRRNQRTEPTETSEDNAETGTEQQQQQQQQQQAEPTSQDEDLAGEENGNDPDVGPEPRPNEGLGSSQRSASTPRSSAPLSRHSSSDSSSDSSHGHNPSPQTQAPPPPPPPPPVTPPPASNNGRYYNQQSPSTGVNPPSPTGEDFADGSRTPDFYRDEIQGGSGDSVAQGPHTPRGTSPNYSPTSPIYDSPDRSSPDYGANQTQQEEPRAEGTHTPGAPSLNYSPTSPDYRSGPGDYAPMSSDNRPGSPDYNVTEPYSPAYGAPEPPQGVSPTQTRTADDIYNSPNWRATSCVPVSESPPARVTPYSPLRSPLTAYDRGEHISPRASGASGCARQVGQGGRADDPIQISSSPLSSSPLQPDSPARGQRGLSTGRDVTPNDGVRSNGQCGAILGTTSPVYNVTSPIYDYEDEENSPDPAPGIGECSVRRDTASSLPDPPNSSAVPDSEQVEQEDHDSLFGDDNSDPENEEQNGRSSSPQAEPPSTPTPAPRLPGLTLPPRNPGPSSAFLVSSVPAEIVPPLPQFQIFPGSMSPRCRQRSWEKYEEGLINDEVGLCQRSPKRVAIAEEMPGIVVQDVGRGSDLEHEQVVERPRVYEVDVSSAALREASRSVARRGNLIDVFTGQRVGVQQDVPTEDHDESQRRQSVGCASGARRLSHPHHHRRT